MHILVTADTLGGVWTYTRELVSGLSQQGHHVTLVSFGDIPAQDQSAWLAPLKRVDFRPTAFRLEWMQECEDDLRASSDYLLSVIDEVKPDVLHFSQFSYGTLPCDVPRIVVAHSDVLSWWLGVHGKLPPESDWICHYRATVSQGLQGANAVVAPSRWMLETLSSCFGPLRMGSVVYNGRTPSLFNAHLSKEDYALSVGRIWDIGKNSALLDQIASRFPIFLAGSDQSPEHFKDEAGDLGIYSGIKYKGKQNELQLQQLYSHARIYVATSRYEPFGLAPLEAALSGCALLLSDIPSLREIWGDAALYFKNNDAGDLQDTLERLHSDPKVCAEYGSLALQRATLRYGAQRMVNDYINLYGLLAKAGELVA